MGYQETLEKVTLNLESGKSDMGEIYFGTQIFLSGCGSWKSAQLNSLGTIFIVSSPPNVLSDKKEKKTTLFSDLSGSSPGQKKPKYSYHNWY